jgi:acetyltransferase-like isoleucine patch superfamily enzyme
MPVDATHAFADGPSFPRPSGARDRFIARLGHVVDATLRRHRVARSWEVFERHAVVGAGCRLGPAAWCANRGLKTKVRIGAGTVCRGVIRREDFGDGQLVIGENVYIGDDAIISCCDRVEIGNLTLIGHGAQVFDNNSHPLDPTARTEDWQAVLRGTGPRPEEEIDHAPVRIGHCAWLGSGSIVLRGVTIGDGAVVAAASVVTSDVPPNTVVAGNPAMPVRSLH